MYFHKIFSILMLVLLLFLGGCSSKTPYRSDLNVSKLTSQTSYSSNAIIHHASEQTDEYYLGFVEFDDQGQIRKRDQIEYVLDTFRNIALKEDVLLVTFVHGWHHNAAPDDSNVKKFQDLLSRLSYSESLSSQQSRRTARKVLGLYIGWRGESIDIPVVNNLTFWERKNTAENVGLTGVTEVLLKLEEIVNVKKADMKPDVPKPLNSRMVVIGHSFGGAVVFTALQQVLSDRFIGSQPGKTSSEDAQGFGDLVILVNPAFEAMRYATLYDISQSISQHNSQLYCRSYFQTQLPKLAILTSESDYATKYAFPIGRAFSTFFETHTTLARHYCKDGLPIPMSIKEGEADRNTVGHFEPYLTHHLDASATKIKRNKDFKYTQLQTEWSRQKAGNILDFNGSSLTHLKRTHPLNPYLNIKVDSDLISDHNDIWGDKVVRFLRDLIVISTLPVEAGSSTHQEEKQ